MNDSLNSQADNRPRYSDKRTVPRYILIATGEVVEPVSQVRIAGRISEISRKGCYLDALNTLPKETLIQLRISRDKGTFVTPGKIIYVLEGMGMGVAFVDAPAEQMKTLDTWLDELNG